MGPVLRTSSAPWTPDQIDHMHRQGQNLGKWATCAIHVNLHLTVTQDALVCRICGYTRTELPAWCVLGPGSAAFDLAALDQLKCLAVRPPLRRRGAPLENPFQPDEVWYHGTTEGFTSFQHKPRQVGRWDGWLGVHLGWNKDIARSHALGGRGHAPVGLIYSVKPHVGEPLRFATDRELAADLLRRNIATPADATRLVDRLEAQLVRGGEMGSIVVGPHLHRAARAWTAAVTAGEDPGAAGLRLTWTAPPDWKAEIPVAWDLVGTLGRTAVVAYRKALLKQGIAALLYRAPYGTEYLTTAVALDPATVEITAVEPAWSEWVG